jgi:hypothetical protein
MVSLKSDPKGDWRDRIRQIRRFYRSSTGAPTVFPTSVASSTWHLKQKEEKEKREKKKKIKNVRAG